MGLRSFKSPCVCDAGVQCLPLWGRSNSLNVTKRQTDKASQPSGVLMTEGRVLVTYPVTDSIGTDPQTPWCLGAEGWIQVPLGCKQAQACHEGKSYPKSERQPAEVIVRLGCRGTFPKHVDTSSHGASAPQAVIQSRWGSWECPHR